MSLEMGKGKWGMGSFSGLFLILKVSFNMWIGFRSRQNSDMHVYSYVWYEHVYLHKWKRVCIWYMCLYDFTPILFWKSPSIVTCMYTATCMFIYVRICVHTDFFCKSRSCMKYVVNWIPLRICVRSRNTQPHLKPIYKYVNVCTYIHIYI